MKRVLGALVVVVLFAPQARAAEDGDLALGYSVYVGGMRALSLGLELDAGRQAYDMTLVLKTEGLIGRMFPWTMNAFSRGKFADAGVRPAAAGQRSLWNGRERKTELIYRDDGTVAVTTVPARDDWAPKVPEDQIAGTIDVVSAILSVLKRVGTGEPCAASVPVYDGRRRYEFTTRPAGTAVLRANSYLKFSGDAVACNVFLRLPEGTKRPNTLIDLTDENAIVVWLARLQNDLPPVPVKLNMDTTIGAVRAHLATAKRGTVELPLAPPERKS